GDKKGEELRQSPWVSDPCRPSSPAAKGELKKLNVRRRPCGSGAACGKPGRRPGARIAVQFRMPCSTGRLPGTGNRPAPGQHLCPGSARMLTVRCSFPPT